MQGAASPVVARPASEFEERRVELAPAGNAPGDAAAAAATPADSIVVRLFRRTVTPAGIVILAPAMGVTQGFYAPLADWIASQGFIALTFDYRGMGRSRNGPLRRETADILDWARRDCAAAIATALSAAAASTGAPAAGAAGASAATPAAASAATPDLPLIWIGHSLGGQIVPFIPNGNRIDGLVTVAAGSGYWRYNTTALRLRALLLWYAIVPLVTALLGHFPGRRFGVIGDMPRGVIRQWRRWCLHPDYAVGEGPWAREAYASVRAPIVAFGFTDDEMLEPRAVRELHALFTGAPQALQLLSPADVGLRRIGHFGFFRADAEVLWRSHVLPVLRKVVARRPRGS